MSRPYPHSAGFKDQGAGRDAAAAITPQLGRRQEEVLKALRELGSATPDAVAAKIGRPPHIVRPRLSELFLLGVAEKTGERRPSAFGAAQTVYRVAAKAAGSDSQAGGGK